jgi:hypothetical protein
MMSFVFWVPGLWWFISAGSAGRATGFAPWSQFGGRPQPLPSAATFKSGQEDPLDRGTFAMAAGLPA